MKARPLRIAATIAGSGSSAPRQGIPERDPEGPRAVGILDPQADDREVGDRDRQGRAEGVDAGQQLDVGRDHQAEGDHAADRDRHVGGRLAPLQLAQPAGDLAVDRQRVDVAGDAEHRGVGGPEEDRRGDQRHHPAHRVGDPVRVEGGDDAQHRLLDELAAERGLGTVRPGDHRHRHQRDRRHPGVDERHRDRPQRGDPLQVAAVDVDVGREVGGGLDPGVGEHRDHRRVDDVLEAGVGEEVELFGQPVGVHDDERADDDHRQLQAEVGQRQQRQRARRARGR